LTDEHKLRVSKDRVLMKVLGHKRDEVTVENIRLHNEELFDLCFSHNVILVIKFRGMRWTGHVTLTVDRRCAYNV
jgi:hypothetical protein